MFFNWDKFSVPFLIKCLMSTLTFGFSTHNVSSYTFLSSSPVPFHSLHSSPRLFFCPSSLPFFFSSCMRLAPNHVSSGCPPRPAKPITVACGIDPSARLVYTASNDTLTSHTGGGLAPPRRSRTDCSGRGTRVLFSSDVHVHVPYSFMARG